MVNMFLKIKKMHQNNYEKVSLKTYAITRVINEEQGNETLVLKILGKCTKEEMFTSFYSLGR